MNPVDRFVSGLIGSIVLMIAAGAIGPTVIYLIDNLIVLVLVVGFVAGLLRALFVFTNRW